MEGSLRASLPVVLGVFLCVIGGCGRGETAEETLVTIPITSLEGVLTRSGVDFDEQISSDGNGSLRIVAQGPTTVRLFEIEDPDVEDARLIYRAKLRTEEVIGDVYLEMWCRFPGMSEFFSRGLQAPLSGSTEWTSQEILFSIEKGHNPDLVKLNLVIGGRGTVWVDDVVLAKGPLH